ncbi:hypothetical protein M0813_24447 [Anaeramoeba flamelloides]|uniref:Uncharacterized protein n=1 Tax=Anaeramoeba flamelloides TaxID=1746091 RepID=A0ABQ8Y7G6_9EUKA|nr:hypothetical protein M0813_24447 [Anaeramoeba flamelloides]
MNAHLKLILSFLVPILFAIVSVTINYWASGEVTITLDSEKDHPITNLNCYLGTLKIFINGTYESGRVNMDKKLSSMPELSSKKFEDDWKTLEKTTNIINILVYVSFGCIAISMFHKIIYIIFAWIPCACYLFSTIYFIFTVPDLNSMIFNDEEAIYPIIKNGTVNSEKILIFSYSAYLMGGAALSSLFTYIGGIRYWKAINLLYNRKRKEYAEIN